MDQTNPLAELTHKRRLSALGPGGLSRERANMEVRDVHYSHYGRMCPIETPEGPNIGLISYLATYARINEYGFIEAPYRKVDKKTFHVASDITYMTADEEDNYIVAQAAEPVDRTAAWSTPVSPAATATRSWRSRQGAGGLYRRLPRMMVSIATAMIPFLPNDDANRALMGANMQRQAVPLLRPEAPIVGTGMEHKICIDSGVAVLAEGEGEVRAWMPAMSPSVRQRRDQGLPAHQVPALQPRHLHQPEAHRLRGRRVHGKQNQRGGERRTPPSWPTAPPPIRARSPWAATSWSAS
jgi:DNA-directed RNA polymerase subunit beta